jgi:glutamate dehydrogenase
VPAMTRSREHAESATVALLRILPFAPTEIDTKAAADVIEQTLSNAAREQKERELRHVADVQASAHVRLSRLLNASPAVIYSFQASGNFAPTFVSENLTRLFGYSPREYLENPDFWRERVHPDDLARVEAEVGQLFQNGNHSLEYRFRRKDGSYCWVNDEQHMVRDGKGEPLEIVGSWSDITARKEVEDAQAGARVRLSLLLSAAPSVIYSFAASGDFAPIFVSENIQDMLGYRPGEYLENANFWRACVHPEDLPAVEAEQAQLFKVGQHLAEYRFRKKDGSYCWVSDEQRLIRDKNGRPLEVVGSWSNIDARKAAEQMVHRWTPDVEAALAELGEGQRAPHLAIRYANCFPQSYRSAYGAEEAARDILRLRDLSWGQRNARLFHREQEGENKLRLKIYQLGSAIPLSAVVPALENFGFQVLEELPTALDSGSFGYIHDVLLEFTGDTQAKDLLERTEMLEGAIAAVLEGRAENDAFNQLIGSVGLAPPSVVLFRAWFRYLRQTGMFYGLDTVAAALRAAPVVARRIIDLFNALHDPAGGSATAASLAEEAIDAALAKVAAIDDDRILRSIRSVVGATLRTNAFSPAAQEALAFKLDSKAIPGLPAPTPWREIWVYSPRVEGIHLRGGPIARGGLRWSDRRDDFRTEILGLMKAQLVKNAVIVPTGAKGGFYPKKLPSPFVDRDAWLAEGTESYRIFIRSLLSVTDNIVEDKVVHPETVVIRDGDDPYFVVAADKGTASFSDVANAIALERNFWLGDAFASGGSQGYDHKAMGITAKGAWVSVQRHFTEMGVDVQKEPVTVAGCGDMSGDVFGNGMLLSKSLKLVAAFDHRHIFCDPDPDPAASWKERTRLFKLPRSSWADYDPKLISKGGGVFPRTQKAIPISKQVAAILGIEAKTLDPSSLIGAILKSPVDLLWFGGIGTYIKSRDESNSEVGDPVNNAHRVNGEDVRAKVIGEAANLGVTQAGRIAFSKKGGRINTDFIDNSAGVDCSDNEVNIKILLNREMREGRLKFEDRNTLLKSMTDDVAALVLENNRLQTLSLSLAERGGAAALPAQVRVIEIMESSGRIDRAAESLETSDELLRRAQDRRGLTRPELAIILSHGKRAFQDAIETTEIAADPALTPLLHDSFPRAMQKRFATAIDAHRLRREIIATRMANRLVNRLGIVAPFELAEEEGASLAQVVSVYFAADMIFDLEETMGMIEAAKLTEDGRLALFDIAATTARLHLADLLRATDPAATPGQIAERLKPGIKRLDQATKKPLRSEARTQASALRALVEGHGAETALANRIVRLAELDGAVGIADLCKTRGFDEIDATVAYVRLGEAIGLDWAKSASIRCTTSDPWEKLLLAGLTRDFEQFRFDLLGRLEGKDPLGAVEQWLEAEASRIAQFRALVDRARTAAASSAAMLAQIGGHARVLLSH